MSKLCSHTSRFDECVVDVVNVIITDTDMPLEAVTIIILVG